MTGLRLTAVPNSSDIKFLFFLFLSEKDRRFLCPSRPNSMAIRAKVKNLLIEWPHSLAAERHPSKVEVMGSIPIEAFLFFVA